MLEAQRTEAMTTSGGSNCAGSAGGLWAGLSGDLNQLRGSPDDLSAAPVITKDLGLSNTEFGGIVVWFLFCLYDQSGVSGKVYDKVGTRLGFTFSIIVWSVAAMAHALRAA